MMTAEQLKASILQLAMQGKLVEQRTEEGTGKELLSKIKKSKTDGNRNDSFEEDPPFDIPESWEWVKHNFLFQISGGSQPPKSKFSLEMKKGFVRLYQIRDYGDKPVPVFVDKKLVSKFTHKGDILLARYGGSLGKVFWAEEGAYNVAMAKVIPLFNESLVAKEFIFLYYHSSLYQSVVLNASRSAQAGFNKNDLDSMFFPLPPLAEQKRIVAKIEELMPFVEQYATASTKLNTLNATFPDMMKKSILQEAVQGKLVPQDPNDEPASVLLKKITEEKKRLIKEGKIKKQKPLPEITEDEIPFDIPESWEWCYVGDLFDHNTGKAMNSSAKQVNKKGSVRKFITTSNLYWNRFDFSTVKEMFFSDDELARCTATKRDILMCEGGAYFGRTAIWNYDYDICFQNHVHRLRPYMKIKEEFFYYLFYFYRTTGLMKSKGTAMPGLSSVALHGLVIPLPPLAEQERIVSKIEELLPCAEQLSR